MDRNEFCILRILRETEKPIWKKEIHRRIEQEVEMLPLEEPFSIQTVGRRVNDLFEKGLIKAIATCDDEVDRALITAYELSNEGQQEVEEQMNQILKQQVSAFTRTTLLDRELDIDDELLRNTFSDLYNVPRNELEDMPTETVLSALQSLHCLKTARKHLSGDPADQMIEAIEGCHEGLAKAVRQNRSGFQT